MKVKELAYTKRRPKRMNKAQDNWEQRVFLEDIKSEFEEMEKAIQALPEPLRSQKQKQLEDFRRKHFPELTQRK